MLKSAIFGLVLITLLAGVTSEYTWSTEPAENQTHIKIPLTVEKLPPGTLLTRPLAKGVEVQVRGPADIRSNLPGLNLQYRLDLAHLKPGSHRVPIKIDRLDLPQGLSIVDFQPRSIQVQLGLEARKSVPITVFYKGTPAPGYFVAQTVANPTKITLRGAKQDLEKTESISTHPIDVSAKKESFKKETTLDLPENISISANKGPILVSVEIVEEIQTKQFRGVPVGVRGSEDRCEITPPSISMDVKGPLKLLAGLIRHPKFNVYVNVEGLEPGVYVRRATIELPVDTTLIKVQPEIFTVTIRPGQ